MTKGISNVESNSTAYDQEAHIPPIPEVPAILHQFLFDKFKEDYEEDVGPNNDWKLEHYKYEKEIINLFPSKDSRQKTYKAIIKDEDTRDIVAIDRSNLKETLHISFRKDKKGDWVKLSSDQTPNDQQL